MPTVSNKSYSHLPTVGAIAQIVGAVILSLSLICLAALPSIAADVRQINSLSVFRHLLEEDDFLLVFHYTITHDTPPGYPVGRYYHFRLMDSTGEEELGSTSPYPYYDDGYGEGVGALYFSAEDAPGWEGSHIMRIEGNPELHDPVPDPANYPLALSNYSPALTQAENRELLGDYIIEITESLEIDWGVKLTTVLDTGTILNTTGEAYFAGTISGLIYMAPQLFAVQSSVPSDETREWGSDTADAARTRYDDTWVGESLSALGNFLGVDWQVATSLFVLVGAIALFGLSAWKFQTSLPGFLGAAVLMIMGFLMGWVSAAVMGVATLLAAMYFGYILVFRHG